MELYRSVSAMDPLLPEDRSGSLEELALRLIESSSLLSGKLHKNTQLAISELVRPMNSYYSNLIEGHDTHPIDIERALKNDFTDDKRNRDLQSEAVAHINIQKELPKLLEGRQPVNPASWDFLRILHMRFYEELPETFKTIQSEEGSMVEVVPGELRNREVGVGSHIGPFHGSLPQFMDKFGEAYNPLGNNNKSKAKRIIAIAASHHRLVWIHPFVDGNGRVVRLFSDAMFMTERLHSNGLWSISRGLARAGKKYTELLSAADQVRYDDYDGRGNLSNRFLEDFCSFFLTTALDQIEFMISSLDIDNMLSRIDSFCRLASDRGKFRYEARYILTDLFLKGKLSKTESMRLTGTSDKTLKLLTDTLGDLGLLESRKEGKSVWYYPKYPTRYSAMLFPGFYPLEKEIDMDREFN